MGWSVGLHHVTFVDETQTDAPADGGGDAAIGQLQLGIVDLRLITLNDALDLVNRGDLGVKFLFGDHISAQQGLEAFEIALGVPELGLVFRHLSLCLG